VLISSQAFKFIQGSPGGGYLAPRAKALIAF